MKIELDVSTENECTSSPWWLIIDPTKMIKPSAGEVAMKMITGPFFSREEADAVLKRRAKYYSARAVVWCHSGCYAPQYDKAYREAERKISALANSVQQPHSAIKTATKMSRGAGKRCATK